MKRMLEAEGMDIHRARPIDWVWKDRLVKSSLNLVIGNEGVGKGTLVAWVLAKLTKGKLSGSFWEKPCNVGIIGHEDSFDHVWGPRLWAAGCDAQRVRRIRRLDFNQVEVGRDLDEMASVVQRMKIRVLYFDQFLDNLAVDTDHYHAKQVRQSMTPLQTVANEIGVTVIATLHPNKRAENFRQLVQGSSAFNAISRSSLLVADHPDDEGMRVLITGKSNYGVRGNAVEFKILEDHIRPNGRLLKTTKVVMAGKSDLTMEDLITQRKGSGNGKELGQKTQIKGILRSELKDGEWHSTTELMGDLLADGFAERTIRAASREMKLERRKTGFQGANEWRLPQ